MIYFTGDVSLTDGYFNIGFGVGSNIAHGRNPFQNILKKQSDVWIGNFEGVASASSNQDGYASKPFRIKPNDLKISPLFDYWGFANNHAMQHGQMAYRQTVETLKRNGCQVFGSTDQKSVLFKYKCRQVSVTGLSLRVDEFCENPCYWHCPEFADVVYEVKSLPKDAFKVLFVHWGNEFVNRPSLQQKKFAHWLVDVGFDLIIGMHPHVLQGYEDYKHARIYYSLGNFVFDMPSEACRHGAIASLDFDENGNHVFSESYVSIDNKGFPLIVEANQFPPQYRFDYLNECLKKNDNSEPYHREALLGYYQYRKTNRRCILRNLFSHPKEMVDVLFDFIKRKL